MRSPSLHHDAMLRLFRTHRKAFFNTTRDIDDVAIHPLSSIRTTRQIIRYTLAWHNGTKTIVYGHTHSKKTHAFLHAIWKNVFAQKRFLKTPRPIAYLPSIDLFLYEAFLGERLRDVLERRPLPVAEMTFLLTQSAQWLAALHRMPVPASTPFRRAAAFSRTNIIRALSPTLSTHERRELNRNLHMLLTVLLPSLPRRVSFVHRDPHIANIIIDRPARRLAIIDYSESGIGEPMVDVATMIAHLRIALHSFYTQREIELFSERFLDSYRGFARLARGSFTMHLTAYIALVSAHFWAFTVATNPRPNRYLQWVIREFRTLWDESIHLLQ